MLIHGETPNQYKAWLLEGIRTDRMTLRVLSDSIRRFPEMSESLHKTMGIAQDSIKASIAELVEFERWRLREGLAPNEAYGSKEGRDDQAN